MSMSPAIIIDKYFGGSAYYVLGKSYHTPLPDELRPWYCYTTDGGHSILALLKGGYDRTNEDLWQEMCPCPVKAVLRDYEIVDGYTVVPLKYSKSHGLMTDSGDDEF